MFCIQALRSTLSQFELPVNILRKIEEELNKHYSEIGLDEEGVEAQLIFISKQTEHLTETFSSLKNRINDVVADLEKFDHQVSSYTHEKRPALKITKL